MRHLLVILVLLSSFSADLHTAKAAETIPVYSYYASAPFSFGPKKGGMVQEILQEIDDRSDKLSFDLRIISRPTLTNLLQHEKKPFIVPFAHPIWFQDVERTKYLWSRPLFSDYNALISNTEDPVNFKGLYSFIFQDVGVPKGYRIYLLDDLVEKKKAQRIDVASIPALVKMVARKQVRMAVIPYAIARYQVDAQELSETIYFSRRPHQTYERHLMLVNGTEEMIEEINKAIHQSKSEGRFKKALKPYGY